MRRVETELQAGNASNFAIGGFDFNGGFIGNKGVFLPASSLGASVMEKSILQRR